MMFRRMFLSIAILVFGAAAAQAGPEETFDLQIPAAPMAFATDHGIGLVYELQLGNFTRHDLQPVRVDVLDGADGRVLASYDGADLEQRLDRSGMQWKAETFRAIPSGRRGVVFIELSLVETPPRALRHRIGYLDGTTAGVTREVEGGDTPVIIGRTPVLAPPLKGGPWVAIHDPRWERGHRRVAYSLGGRLRTPGRHAIDFVKLDATGRKAPVGEDLAARTYSHGQTVRAVADGVVVRVVDRFPERARLSDETRSEGNHIVLALEGGHYAHYGHLRPGSATVESGARVKSGDKIAEVGFSGSASDPQLHFALTDGPEELASEGVACTFTQYRLLGGFDDASRIGTTGWTPSPGPAPARPVMPTPMSVIEWLE